MPPRLRIRPELSHGKFLAAAPPRSARPPACLFCSLQLAKPLRPTLFRDRHHSIVLRAASTAAAPDTTAASQPIIARNASSEHARTDLVRALSELQKHAGVFTNLSRLQLAIRGLQQEPGQETIRVAVIGLVNGGGNSGKLAKELLRLILADPLKDEQPWEARLASHDPAQPLVVRVRASANSEPVEEEASGGSAVRLAKDNKVTELEVSSALLNGNNMEFLLVESSLAAPVTPKYFEGEMESFEEAVLVPTVETPVSSDDRSTFGRTPVHQALIVADGILGATTVAPMPLMENKKEILAAVNLKNRNPEDMAGCPFVTLDTTSSAKAIAFFRESVANAIAYETTWRESGMPSVMDWLRVGATGRTDGTTKPPVRQLVSSILRNTLANIQDAEAKQLAPRTSVDRPGQLPDTSTALHMALASWAEKAHAELQEQLDIAFASRPWRKLGWWKLFWRVDDVTMLSSGLISQRFLPRAEQEAIYLAGRIEEAARLGQSPDNHQTVLNTYTAPTFLSNSTATDTISQPLSKWPMHISFTRHYVLDKTVPALQALAQKLVLQTAATSGLTTILAALTYLSSLGAYEAGAVAALGLVWSLGRMQKQWETARGFWEGEVREEGRKAVRAVETSTIESLDRTQVAAAGEKDRDRALHDLRQARELVKRAEEALQRLK